MWNKGMRYQAGVTLVELIVAMVIIAVGIGGMIQAFTSTSKNSADPLVYKQMVVVAEGIMEEVLLKPFDISTGGTTRAEFNDVLDFNGYATVGITDVSGAPIPSLSKYNVTVAVTPAALSGGVDALRITVTVSREGFTYVLTGWRTDYA